MPRVKEPKKKPEILPCIFDHRIYEVCEGGRTVASETSFTEAKRIAARLHRVRKRPRYPERIAINLKSTCVYGPEVCKYWKSCVELKGTTFNETWGKKKVMLLEMERQQRQGPKHDKDLDQFL